MAKHECKLSDLVWGNRPDVDGGECVSIPVTCRFCGRKFEEVYGKNDGLWDIALGAYVFLPAGDEQVAESVGGDGAIAV